MRFVAHLRFRALHTRTEKTVAAPVPPPLPLLLPSLPLPNPSRCPIRAACNFFGTLLREAGHKQAALKAHYG